MRNANLVWLLISKWDWRLSCKLLLIGGRPLVDVSRHSIRQKDSQKNYQKNDLLNELNLLLSVIQETSSARTGLPSGIMDFLSTSLFNALRISKVNA